MKFQETDGFGERRFGERGSEIVPETERGAGCPKNSTGMPQALSRCLLPARSRKIAPSLGSVTTSSNNFFSAPNQTTELCYAQFTRPEAVPAPSFSDTRVLPSHQEKHRIRCRPHLRSATARNLFTSYRFQPNCVSANRGNKVFFPNELKPK